jgi:FMN phosphatase YigB (HAD superfamily)
MSRKIRWTSTKSIAGNSSRAVPRLIPLDPAEQRSTLKNLIREHGAKPVEDFEQFLEEVGDAWPADESVDDFIAAIRAMRREGNRVRCVQ